MNQDPEANLLPCSRPRVSDSSRTSGRHGVGVCVRRSSDTRSGLALLTRGETDAYCVLFFLFYALVLALLFLRRAAAETWKQVFERGEAAMARFLFTFAFNYAPAVARISVRATLRAQAHTLIIT